MEALNIPDEDFTSILIRYGLYVGAIFQIVCLGAVIFLPSPKNTGGGSIWGFLKGDDDAATSPQDTPKRPHHRSRRTDKKKKR